MKTVKILARCDRCSGEVEEGTAGYGILVSLGQKKPVEADLCATCLIDAHNALDAAIAAGIKPGADTSSSSSRRGNWSKREQVACTICGKTITTGAGQVLHARKIHGLEKEDVWGPTTAPELQPA